MMSIEQINQESQRAASVAASEDQRPLFIDQFDLALARRGNYAHLSIPFIGDYLPEGYQRQELTDDIDGVYSGDNSGYGAFFVDSSGFGGEGEAAITLGRMFEVMETGYYAVVEAGQFQVKVGMFRKITD